MKYSVFTGLVISVMLSTLTSTARAQCLVATDPAYGRSPLTAVPIGGALPVEHLLGGVLAADHLPRIERYLRNLRGLWGETPVFRHLGSAMVPDPADPANNRRVVIWSYTVTLPSTTGSLYLNLSDFGMLQAPIGFTCALEPSPLDAAIAIRQTEDFVAQHSESRELQSVSLDADGTSRHGVAFDNFRMLFLRARASNRQIPPLPTSIGAAPLVVVAFPRDCSGRSVLAESIDIVSGHGETAPRVGGLARTAQLATMLPGATFPENSVGAMFSVGYPSLRAGDAVRIRYAASDCSNENEAILPATYEAARLTSSPVPILPTGITEVVPTVLLQVLVDTEGRFEQPVVLSGPESLRAAAVETIKKWTVTPARVNGSPVFSFSTLQVTFVP